MFEIDNEINRLTESKKRELMLEIEELAQLEGLRNYAQFGSEFSISADIQTLIDSKADKTEFIRHDGSVSLTGDWDIGNGRTIKTDKIMARDSNGLALFEDGNSGIFIKDGGSVGVGTSTHSAKLSVNGGVHVGGDSDPGNDNLLVDGKLGIGVTPIYKLDVYGTCALRDQGIGGEYAIFNFINASGVTGAYIGLGSHGSNELQMVSFGSNMRFYAGSNWHGILNSSGNWGFGTQAPNAKVAINGGLHVGGDSDPGDNNLLIDGKIEIDGDLDHDGSNVGFFGVSPIARQSALTTQLNTVTCSNPSTPDYSISDPINTNAYGWTTADEFKTVMNVIANLQTRLGELEARLKNYGLLQ